MIFRHSCASLLLANGVPLKQIQEWLGHSDFSTTANIYAHLDYRSKISSAQAMEQGMLLPRSDDFGSRWENVTEQGKITEPDLNPGFLTKKTRCSNAKTANSTPFQRENRKIQGVGQKRKVQQTLEFTGLFWRRGWDSNPWSARANRWFSKTSSIKPLGHLSTVAAARMQVLLYQKYGGVVNPSAQPFLKIISLWISR